jgi:predicted N-formylglutamate amidohydrolase
MLRVTIMPPIQILSAEDGPVARVVNPQGRAPVCLVCEHASAAIPASLGTLGLAEEDRYSHAVWDPGALALAESLSNRLDAPLVHACVSRLVYDCNRPPERADAMPARSETIEVPGNTGLTEPERQARTREVYDTFHAAVSARLDSFATPPALVTIHSFSPVWFDVPRPTEIGILHDEDPSLALAMMKATDPAFQTDLNQPYSAADGVTHMLARHGTARSLSNVMIEVRNDLLSDEKAVSRVAETLEAMLNAALSPGTTSA